MLRKLVGYAAYMFGANAFTALMTFAVSAVGMVKRSKAAFGDYMLYMAIYSIGQGFFIYGVNASIQKYASISREHRLRFVKITYQLFAVLLVLGGAVGVPLGLFVSWNYGLASFAIPMMVLYWWSRYIFRSTLNAKREAQLMVILSFSNTVGRFSFLTFTDWRDALVYGDFFSVFCGCVASALILPGSVQASFREIFRVQIPKAFIQEVIKFGRGVWLAGVVFLVKGQLQTIWTRAGLGAAPLGGLGVYHTMWQFVQKPVEFISQATLPGLVRAEAKRDELFRDVLRMCLLSFPAIAMALAIGSPLLFQAMDYFSGSEPLLEKYAEVPVLMLIAVAGLPIQAVEMVSNQYSIAENRQKSVLFAHIVNVVIMAIVLIPLTKAFGIFGVVIAGVIGELGNMLTYATILYRTHKTQMRTAVSWGFLSLLCCIPGLALGYEFQGWVWSWSLALPATLSYLTGMFVFRLLRVDDLRRVLQAFQGWRQKPNAVTECQ